ncbi:restriction endonuclease subunit S [Dietzia cinnamea]|nr:restriction endonuclease subunit S [Dietzia cinnamea]
MSEWSDKAIGDLGTVVTGSTPPSRHPDWFGNEVPFVTPSDMNEGDRRPSPGRCLSRLGRVGLKTRIVPANAVAFVCIGATIGKVCLLPTESVTNQQINTIVPNSDTDSRFLYYLLRYAAQGIAQGASGAATPIINKSVFSSVVVRVPDLATQIGIGQVLGSFDDLIENNRRRVEVLEEMARAIYREWFVKFRYPGHSDVPMTDSALGPIPERWMAGTIGDVLELKYGKALKADARRGGGVAVVSSAGVVGWHDEMLVDGPAIVVGRKGNVGSVHWVDGPCWPIDTAYYVSTDLPLRFVAEQLRRSEFTNSHAAVPGLSREAAYARPFLVPPSDLLASYQTLADSFGTQAASLSWQSENLRALRDLLLPKLVTGQIDVSTLDLDVLLEEAVA